MPIIQNRILLMFLELNCEKVKIMKIYACLFILLVFM